MHDTALQIGHAAIDLYAGKNAKILEIGAMDVNGSLRQFAPEDSTYLGVDLEAGKGVDQVIEAGKPLPFKKGTFDLILASSVFEHDPAFWQTFLNLARVLRKGGHLYISAPSNGTVHRYPEDHWRFYPDSGLALERWSFSQDLPMRLVESFTAPRERDVWNDFVAVFRRGKRKGELSGQFLHAQFGGKNAWTMGAREPLKSDAQTEDMHLIKTAQDKISALDTELSKLRESSESATHDLQTLGSTLRQRDEEIAQTRRELESLEAKSQSSQNELREKLAELEELNAAAEKRENELRSQLTEFEEQAAADRRAREEAELSAEQAREAFATVENKLRKQRTRARRLTIKNNGLHKELRQMALIQAETVAEAAREKSQSQQKLSAAARDLSQAQSKIEERFGELATLTKFLQSAETAHRKAEQDRAWLAEVQTQLAELPMWWAFLSESERSKRKLHKLNRAGLFDGQAYLDLYPDVAEAGMDPLRHYLLHGMEEGRTLTR